MKKKFFSIGILVMIITLLSGCSAAGHYDKEGKKNFENGKYEEAAVNFRKAIEKNSNRADYYIDYGMTLIALGKYKDSLSQFDQIYMNKDMSVVKENNKRILRGKGIAYYHMQNYDSAVKEFEKALDMSELPGLNVDILYYMGSSLRSTGSYNKAINAYNTILKNSKKNARAYGERAACYSSMGLYEKSIADFDKAISLEPDNYEYYFGKYDMLLENGDAAGAEDVLTKAAEINVKKETDADKYNLAKIYYYQGDYDKAITQLQDSLQKGFSEAYYYLGEIDKNKKDYTKAVYYYEKYINTGKVLTSNVYNQAAVCLIKTSDYEKAVKYIKLGLAFNDAGTMRTLKKNEIIAYENLGNFDEANKNLKDYLASYPDDKDAVREAEFIKTRLLKSETENSNE